MEFKRRTHTCGELRPEHAGQKVVLNGWVQSRRDLGGLIFINLRDRYGITQVVFEPDTNAEAAETGKKLRSEFVIAIEGEVRIRPEANPNLPTGQIDISVEHAVILSEAQTSPFEIKDDVDANEDLRLKYRYLDLRRSPMRDNMLLRHKVYLETRKFFDSQNFVEIETPILMKSTPEGARDFLVPSRMHKGKFYALPQSPQTYKQLLMVSGFDRYFQIVKCFRDEDFRADRQPEFTQIDVEMSFVDVEDIFEVVENLMKLLYKNVMDYEIKTPLPRIPFSEAMEKYGSDKPDLRFGLEMHTLNEIFAGSEFKVFASALEENGIITGFNVKGLAEYSRKQLDELTDFVKKLGAGGLVWLKIKDDIEGPAAKFLSDKEKDALKKEFNAEDGDLLLILSGAKKMKTLDICGDLRKEVAKQADMIPEDAPPALLWVTDFPLFEWDDETQRFYAMHHPFTSPRFEDVDKLESDPGSVRARAYDLVLNGTEIAGGSIRIHNKDMQAAMFKALGISDEEAKEKFGFLMEAFSYGAPPHGGIAFGFDRMVMLFAGEDSIRDVIAFPKTTSGLSLMDGCPSGVDEKQLNDLHIQLKK